MIDLNIWKSYIDTLDYQPVFVTVSGAHLYGFESPDSDVDLRGCHQLPLRAVVGLALPNETYEKEEFHQGVEVDLVSHEIGKYLRLLVKNNGYILEQVFSPLIVRGESFLDELRPIAARCITRHHYHHYRGFYGTQSKLIDKQPAKTAKAVLYAYRVLLTGIQLLRTGEMQANVLRLNEDFKLGAINELIAMKTQEKIAPADLDWPSHAKELDSLEALLDKAFEESTLPEGRDKRAVNDLLVKMRLGADA